jgi:hypothetical protein
VQFAAKVQNAQNSAVNWLVNQTPGGDATSGTITPDGYYTAPGQVPSMPVTVTAALRSDSSVSGSATVSVQSSLTVSPPRSGVTTSQSVALQVTSAGVQPNQLAWSVDRVPNGSTATGTISMTGNGATYVPPPAAGTHIIAAALNTNSNVNGQATVYVTDLAGSFTWRNDNARSGINGQELALSPSTVNSNTFGKLFSCTVDGYIYAQPLYAANLPIPGSGTRNVVFVATDKNSVYAFDADAKPCAAPLWKTSLVQAGEQPVEVPNLQIPSTPMGPFVGITGSPAIDANASLLYAVAATQIPALNSTYNHVLYALDLATGSIVPPSGAAVVSPDSQFHSQVELQRSALLLDQGSVYVAFGSNAFGSTSPGPYHGWLFKHDAALLQSPEAFNVTPLPASGNGGGGIWQSGGGPSADSNHNVYVATGDGPFNANRSVGSLSYSDSFLRFPPSSIGSVADYFAPCDQFTDEASGDDVGASAPVLLPDSAGSLLQPHLLMGGSKSGSLYFVNRDNMGTFNLTGCPDSTTAVQTVPAGGPILSTPLYWNNAVYVAPANANLESLPVPFGVLSSCPASQSGMTLGPQGTTPALSWNAASNDIHTAVLWLIDTSGALASTPGAAVLRAYDPCDLSNELYDSTMAAKQRDQAGLAVKFTVPTVANGKVYVGTQSELDVYGLLP